VFISSKQREFAVEREGMVRIIERLPLLAADAAEEWAPGRGEVEQTYLARVQAAPIYVGLFGGVYSAPTIAEYEAARANPYREILIYVKGIQAVEPELAAFLARIDDPKAGHTTKHYRDWAELAPVFERHLWAAVQRMVDYALRLADAAPTARSGRSSVLQRKWAREQAHLAQLGLPVQDGAASTRAWVDEARQTLATFARATGFPGTV